MVSRHECIEYVPKMTHCLQVVTDVAFLSSTDSCKGTFAKRFAKQNMVKTMTMSVKGVRVKNNFSHIMGYQEVDS